MEGKGFTTEVLDLAFADNPEKELERYLGKNEVLLIALTVRNLDDSYLASQDFCLQRTKVIIDQIRSRTEAPLVLGGVGFSIRPESALSYCGVEMGIKGRRMEFTSIGRKAGRETNCRRSPFSPGKPQECGAEL